MPVIYTATSPSSGTPPASNPPSRWTPRYFVALASGNSHKPAKDAEVKPKDDTGVELKQDSGVLPQKPEVQLKQDAEFEPDRDTQVMHTDEQREGKQKLTDADAM